MICYSHLAKNVQLNTTHLLTAKIVNSHAIPYDQQTRMETRYTQKSKPMGETANESESKTDTHRDLRRILTKQQ